MRRAITTGIHQRRENARAHKRFAENEGAAIRGRILQGGMYIVSNDSTPPKLVDLMLPTPPGQWLALSDPVDAAAVQHCCY